MITFFNKILWSIATILIVSSGIYFTKKIHFGQFRIKKMIQSIMKKESTSGISSFSSLMLVLAGRIGVGSIAGVAIAIHLGGVGSIFWMWVMAFLSAPNCYMETVLGNLYKRKDENDLYKGGPSYYMRDGLGWTKIACLYSFIVLVSYIGGFLGIQANTITRSLNEIISISPLVVGSFLVVITGGIIFGGLKTISHATSKLVPLMTLFYLVVTGFILGCNITKIPSIFLAIIKDAFRLKSFFSGFLTSVIVGIQRGIFSNEAGLGTGAIASSTVESEDSTKEGYVQMLGIYITTLLICTSTAFIILTSNYQDLVLKDINGIEITQYAFFYHLSKFGNWFIFLSILLFSFSTILTGYYYGESSLKFLFKNVSSKILVVLKIITLGVLFVSCFLSAEFLWSVVDLCVALLAILNICAMFGLRQELKYIKK